MSQEINLGKVVPTINGIMPTAGAVTVKAENILCNDNKTIETKFSDDAAQLAAKAKQVDLVIERERINLIQANPGSTSGDIALNDIKIAADGNTYNSPGDAVRGQYNTLNKDLTSLINGDDTVVLSNKFVYGLDGTIGDISGWTVMIKKVLSGSTCTFKWVSGITYIAQYAIYTSNPIDNNSGYVSGENVAKYSITVPTQEPFYYIAVCINTAELSGEINAKYNSIIQTFNDIYSKITDWRSKTILWLGTSIPEGNQQPAYGYPNVLGSLLGCNMINNAIGASKIRCGLASAVTANNPLGVSTMSDLRNLCQTVAEKQNIFDNWAYFKTVIAGAPDTISQADKDFYLSTSYEIRLDPYLVTTPANVIVLNHGFNDHIEDVSTVPTDPYDRHYFIGAMNFIIHRIKENNPLVKIVIFGHYQHRPDLRFDTIFKNLSDSWNVFYYPLWQYLGWGDYNIATTKRVDADGAWITVSPTTIKIKDQWIYDTVHPKGVARDRIVEVSLPLFQNILN